MNHIQMIDLVKQYGDQIKNNINNNNHHTINKETNQTKRSNSRTSRVGSALNVGTDKSVNRLSTIIGEDEEYEEIKAKGKVTIKQSNAFQIHNNKHENKVLVQCL